MDGSRKPFVHWISMAPGSRRQIPPHTSAPPVTAPGRSCDRRQRKRMSSTWNGRPNIARFIAGPRARRRAHPARRPKCKPADRPLFPAPNCADDGVALHADDQQPAHYPHPADFADPTVAATVAAQGRFGVIPDGPARPAPGLAYRTGALGGGVRDRSATGRSARPTDRWGTGIAGAAAGGGEARGGTVASG